MRAKHLPLIPRWGRFEGTFQSAIPYRNPLQDATIAVTFRAPSGREHTVAGFWDGGTTWRVRFSPDEIGAWHYVTSCSDTSDSGLHNQSGGFGCSITAASGATPWTRHGPVVLADDRYSLAHADGTPFLWIGDTAWNGPLLATEAEWQHYLNERTRQGCNAVQWVATQWIAAPAGDRDGRVAFTGHERIAIDPVFFQRLDRFATATEQAGLVNVPVLLWAAEWGDPQVMSVNPGASLPEDQAILLARYMVARWHAHAVVWILPGDGDYRGAHADRWRRIGRAVFGATAHGPVALHPGGMQWVSDGFRDEPWLDIIGYQSGHGDSEETCRWLVEGPPASDWRNDPPRPQINLEPPYENHIAYQSKLPLDAFAVRRALYWSMLNGPTAGVTYGGHGVWGWDDGSGPPTAHPTTGTPLPWQEALVMPAAEQIDHLRRAFAALPWWELRPAPALLLVQPGANDARRHIAVSRATSGAIVVAYTPFATTIVLDARALPTITSARWCDPCTGTIASTSATYSDHTVRFTPPDEGDWLLVVEAGSP